MRLNRLGKLVLLALIVITSCQKDNEVKNGTELKRITLKSSPDKVQDYCINETLDLKGTVISLTLDDGTLIRDIPFEDFEKEGITCDPKQGASLEPGDNEISLSHPESYLTIRLNVVSGVFDIDGNLYTIIRFGDQVWMAEDLKTETYNDSEKIPLVSEDDEWITNTSGACCRIARGAYCNTDTSYVIEWNGIYYNWHAVNSGKLSPQGWHVASDTDWEELENYLADNGYNYDGSNGGGREKIAKSMAALGVIWSSTVYGSVGSSAPVPNNSSGFSGVLLNRRDSTYYTPCHERYFDRSYWWTSSEEESLACYRGLVYNSTGVERGFGKKWYGMSVRCVKD